MNLDNYTRQQLANIAAAGHAKEAARLSKAFERATGNARNRIGMEIELVHGNVLAETWNAAEEKAGKPLWGWEGKE